MWSRLHHANRDAESFDDALFIRSHNKRTLPDEEHAEGDQKQIAEPAGGEQIAELALGLLEGLIQIVALFAPRVFGVPDHRVAQLFRSGEDAEGPP